MNITRKVLLLPRYLLLSVLALMGPVALALCAFAWFADINQNNSDLIAPATTSFTFLLIFLLIKRSKLLIPGIRMENFARENAAKAINNLREHATAKATAKIDFNHYKQDILDRSTIAPFDVIVLGGSGREEQAGQKLLFSIDSNFVYLTDIRSKYDSAIPIAEIVDIEVGGPGTQTKSAGISGGGFGVEGAATGIAIASAINLLTIRSTTNTTIRFATRTSELFLHTSSLDPTAARIRLSELFVKVGSHCS